MTAPRSPNAASDRRTPSYPRLAEKQATANYRIKPCNAHTSGIATAPKVQNPSKKRSRGPRKYMMTTCKADEGASASCCVIIPAYPRRYVANSVLPSTPTIYCMIWPAMIPTAKKAHSVNNRNGCDEDACAR